MTKVFKRQKSWGKGTNQPQNKWKHTFMHSHTHTSAHTPTHTPKNGRIIQSMRGNRDGNDLHAQSTAGGPGCGKVESGTPLMGAPAPQGITIRWAQRAFHR